MTAKSDFQWFIKATDALAPFQGEYVAVLDGKIVSHGKTADIVLKEITRLHRRPLICFIPTDEALEL